MIPLACPQDLKRSANTRISFDTYLSPLISSALTRIGDIDVIITPGGHAVRLSDGKTLASDLGHCTYTSPIVHGSIIYFIDKSISAIELPEKPADEIEGKELWFEDLTGELYSSPSSSKERSTP